MIRVLMPIRLDRAQTPIATLLREIAMRNQDIEFTGFSGPVTDEDRSVAEKLWSLPNVQKAGLMNIPGQVFDVVHTASATRLNYSAVQLARRLCGNPQHVFTANCEPYDADVHLHWYERAVSACDRLVAVSKVVSESVAQRWSRTAADIVPNGFDDSLYVIPEEETGKEESLGLKRGFVLYACAMIGRKHPEFFLDLAERMPDLQFVMVGSTADRAYSEPIEKRAAGLANVDFRGRVTRTKLRDLMQLAGCMIWPSDYEGLPLTVVEAMGCGLPVIAQPKSALPEVIEHEKDGWLFPLEPIEQWEEKVRDILAWPMDTRKEFAQRTRQSVCDRFTWDVIAQDYARIYREVGAPDRVAATRTREVRKRKLVIMTGPLAPYRLNLYRALGRELGPKWDEVVVYGREQQRDHQWTEFLKERSDHCELLYLPGREVPVAVLNLMKRLGLSRGRALLPGLQAIKEVVSQRPDVLWVSELTVYTILPLLVARLGGSKVVLATELGKNSPREACSGVIKWLHQLLGTQIDLIVANAPAARTPVWGEMSERVIFSPHAIEVDSYAPSNGGGRSDGENITLLFVGNLIHRKGIDLMLRAFRLASERGGGGLGLRIVGGGDSAWVKRLIEGEGLESQVELAGFREGNALLQEYAKADAFLFLTRFDTYGVVVHEACASGLPLIVSSRAGSAEVLVKEGENGFVTDPEDVERVAARILQLRDPVLRESMRAASLKMARNYDVDKLAAEVCRKIEELGEMEA